MEKSPVATGAVVAVAGLLGLPVAVVVEHYIGSVPSDKMRLVCEALAIALGCVST